MSVRGIDMSGATAMGVLEKSGMAGTGERVCLGTAAGSEIPGASDSTGNYHATPIENGRTATSDCVATSDPTGDHRVTLIVSGHIVTSDSIVKGQEVATSEITATTAETVAVTMGTQGATTETATRTGGSQRW